MNVKGKPKKFDNWMRPLADALHFKGMPTLVIPGVANGQQAYQPVCNAFITSQTGTGTPPAGCDAAIKRSLRASLLEAGKEIKHVVEHFDSSKPVAEGGNIQIDDDAQIALPSDDEQAESRAIMDSFSDGPEDGKKAYGIKGRAAMGALAGLAYWRHTPPASRQACIKIIGHSRGGCSAIGAHNLISYFGIPVKTITLDPCHGANRSYWFVSGGGAGRNYWYTVHAGKVVNMPAVRGVADMAPKYFERPEITQAGTSTVINQQPFTATAHGHLDKFCSKEDSGCSFKGNASLCGSRVENFMKAANKAPNGSAVADLFVTDLLFTEGTLGPERRRIGNIGKHLLKDEGPFA